MWFFLAQGMLPYVRVFIYIHIYRYVQAYINRRTPHAAPHSGPIALVTGGGGGGAHFPPRGLPPDFTCTTV